MKKRTIKILYSALILSLILSCNSVYAAAKKEAESDGITKGGVAQNHAGKCKSYLGINITATEYSRDTTRTTNNVANRTITMSCKGRCKYYIYVTKYGELEKLSSDSKTNDNDEEDNGDENNLPKPKKKTFYDSATYTLSPGKEALVIVVSLNRKENCKKDKDGVETCEYPKKKVQHMVNTGTAEKPVYKWEDTKVDCDPCKKKNSDGSCAEWSKCTVTCPKGRYNSEDVAVDEIDIKGNGAALFVQNPEDSGFVPNLRRRTDVEYGSACQNAYDGYHTTDEKFSVPANDLEEYRKYYNKFMPFCEEEYFAFNIKETQIEKMSNALLEAYYYAKNISSDNYEAVHNLITDLTNQIRTKYGADHILTSETQLKNKSLACDYSKERKTVDEYMYIKDGGTIKAELSTGTVDVCTTQCYEHVTVRYDEPKTVKAGMCFSYKVTIKSESDCAIKPLYDFNKVGQPTRPCSPVPICSNNSSNTQAGPNEDFDKCIKSCDNGEYSQSCINSCYKQVYENKSKTTNTTRKTNNSNKTKVTLLTSSQRKNNILRLKQPKKNSNLKYKNAYDEDYLKNYHEEDNNDDCTTDQIIKYVQNNNDNMLTECADYFFQAKTLYPHGYYSGNSWQKNAGITNAGADKDETTNIPMQVARSAPFYFRSLAEAKKTLKDLVVPKDKTGTWRKYNIDENGIKRQYSSRFHCDEVCSYTGCKSGTAMSPNKYTSTTTSDLNKLADALQKCNVSSSCDKKEETTSFDIAINTKSKTKTGGSAANQTRLNSNVPVDSSNTGNEIFIGEFSNKVINEEGLVVSEKHYDRYSVDGVNEFDDFASTGILGECYKVGKLPHYQTTITYPGTYLNFKNSSRSYTYQSSDSYYKKDKYFCTPFDDEDVNVKYWGWVEKEHYNPQAYPEGWSPDSWNIKASLGKNDSGFGKYNWSFNFQCFYAEFNEIPTDDPGCLPSDPNYPTCKPGCSQSDPNYPTCKNECDSKDSTRFCNLNFRAVDSTNMFPTAGGGRNMDRDAGQSMPFNWTKDATDTNTDNGGTELFKYGYGVNPADYKDSIETKTTDSFSGHIAYEVYLDKEAIKELKEYTKNHSYTSLYENESSTARYRTIGNTNLRYYQMDNVVRNHLTIDDGHPGRRCSDGSC